MLPQQPSINLVAQSGSSAVALQNAYDNSGGASPSITYSAANGSIVIRGDAAVTNVLELLNGAGVSIFAMTQGGSLRVANSSGVADATGSDAVFGNTAGAGTSRGVTLFTDNTGRANIYFGSAASSVANFFRFNFGTSAFEWAVGAAARLALTATALSSYSNGLIALGSSGSRFSNVFTQGLNMNGSITHTGTFAGFFSAAPVAQPSTTGTTAGFTAGVGAAVNVDSTFTGNTGATAYTMGDVVRALKQLGWMAA